MLYDSEYFLRREYDHDPKREAMYVQEIRRLIVKFQIADARLNILDVGCGLGGWFAHAHYTGWKKYAIEPSKYAAAVAREKGITVLEFKDIDDGAMDVVIFRGSIQHIDEPFKALREATRVLVKGGLLIFLATPNTGSIVYRLFGHLPALDPPRNWLLVSEKQLRQILTNLGYEQIEFYFPYWFTPYARPALDFMKFALRCLGIRVGKYAFPKNMMECYAVRP